MPEPRSLCNQICSCCKSVGAIRTCIVIFGITTVALAAYAHLESPYTTKASTPYYDEYFTTWERMHNYTSPHKNANELVNSSTTENKTETSTLSSEDQSTEETDNVRNGGVSSTTDDIQTQSTPESNPDITPDTVRRKRQDPLITSTEIYTTTLSQITTETSVETTNVMDDAESTTESIFNTTANTTNFNDSTTENHTKIIHAVTLGAQKVLDLTPRIVESGYETCLSFKLFMHELEERLIELDISTQLTTIKSEDVPDNVDVLLKDCPDLFYERCFLGAAIISLLLTTLCVSLAVIFCPKLIGRLVSRLIDASYHLLCGIALLAGAGLTVKFLYDMDQICTTSADLHEQFYEAIAEYQLHWHFRTNKSFNLLDDRGNVEKLNKINDNLVPRYYGFLTEQNKNEGQTDPTTTAANSTNPTSQQHVKRKRKRKFSWTRRYSKRYRKTVIENEGWFSQGAYACEFYMKYYWKAAAVISGTITAILYIVAAIGILFKKEQPKPTTPPDSEESTTEESEDEDSKDAENTNIDDKPQEATNKIKEDNTDDNKNDNNNNNNTEKPAKTGCFGRKK